MKKRLPSYLLIGLTFGIFDFYFQGWIQDILPAGTFNYLVQMVPILGIWLIPIIPIIYQEVNLSKSIWKSSFVTSLTWGTAVVGYYGFMAIKLLLIGQDSRIELHISSRNDPYYWSNVKNFIEFDISGGIGEWMLFALVGGCLTGLLLGLIIQFLNRRKIEEADKSRTAD